MPRREVSQNDAPKPFQWDARKEAAAALLAEDHLTDEKIAVVVGCSRPTLVRWKTAPEFAARVQEIAKRLGDLALRHAVARRHKRVAALQERWEKMRRVIEERGDDPRMADIPGGKTGLLVVEESEIVDGRVVPTEVAVDTGLLKELRELEKQAAQEVGQWTEKKELTGKDGERLLGAEDLDDDRLARIAAGGRGGTAAPPSGPTEPA